MGSATLTNFILRSDGFSFGGFTLSPTAALSLGDDVVTATGATLAVTSFNVAFGNGSTAAGVSGTITLTLNGVSLFPDSGLVTFSATSVGASYDFGSFDGTSPSGRLKLDIVGFTLSIGSALQLSAVTASNPTGEVIINPGATGNVPMASISSATLSSPVFSDLGTLTVNNLVIYQTGFTLANAVWASPGSVNVGGFFSASSLSITLSNVALLYAGTGSSISGGVTVTITAGFLFPSIPFLDIPLGDFVGTLSFGLSVPTFSFSFSSSGHLDRRSVHPPPGGLQFRPDPPESARAAQSRYPQPDRAGFGQPAQPILDSEPAQPAVDTASQSRDPHLGHRGSQFHARTVQPRCRQLHLDREPQSFRHRI